MTLAGTLSAQVVLFHFRYDPYTFNGSHIILSKHKIIYLFHNFMREHGGHGKGLKGEEQRKMHGAIKTI